MPRLDHNAVYLISALLITVVVLGVYTLYLWSRLRGASRRATGDPQSARNVAAAPPMVSSVQTPNSANGPSAA